MYYKTSYISPIGKLTLYAEDDFLIEVRFPRDRHEAVLKNEIILENDNLEIFIKTKKWLDEYFKGCNPDISLLSIKFIGSDFKKEVWKHLCEIPYGEVVTYKDIARKISQTMSSQAVGVAVGYNPLCIIVPCHRVIGVNNNLVGFGGGLEIKKYLLKHEGVDIMKLKTPKKGNAL